MSALLASPQLTLEDWLLDVQTAIQNFDAVNEWQPWLIGDNAPLPPGRKRRSPSRQRKRDGLTVAYPRLYGRYNAMIYRCTNPADPGYSNYGGRGITICKQWLKDFQYFQRWAITHGYEEHLTLDRRDNDGPYSPKNCRWVTHTENVRNRRVTRWITHFGETKCIEEWARDTRVGLARETIRHRVLMGLSPEEILKPGRRARGKSKPFTKWAQRFDCCIECGTSDRPHKAYGRCQKCTNRFNYQKEKA